MQARRIGPPATVDTTRPAAAFTPRNRAHVPQGYATRTPQPLTSNGSTVTPPRDVRVNARTTVKGSKRDASYWGERGSNPTAREYGTNGRDGRKLPTPTAVDTAARTWSASERRAGAHKGTQ